MTSQQVSDQSFVSTLRPFLISSQTLRHQLPSFYSGAIPPVLSRPDFSDHTADPTFQTGRQPRLHVASFNGTFAGGVLSSRKTVIPEFVKLISEHENVFETPINGVGSDGSLVGRIMGGVGGLGTQRNVMTAFKNLAKHYKPGDRIILSGYSRGAWAARYLALLIDLLGLPKDGDERFFQSLYRACGNGSIWDAGISEVLLDETDCWRDIKISALCCFDTVGSLGLPLTGLARPLAIFNHKKKHDMVSDVAPNVEFAFHCLSLHEIREPYTLTLMRGTNVHQVSFPGNHSHLGWIEENEGLQIRTFVGISFDEAKLTARFPSYRQKDSVDIPVAQWYKGRIQHIHPGLLAAMGKKSRRPGHTNCTTGDTDLKIQIGACLRNDLDDTNTVPGYVLMAPLKGKPYWARRLPSSRTLTNSDQKDPSPIESLRLGNIRIMSATADRIDEAPVGALEARLLGLPQEVVGMW